MLIHTAGPHPGLRQIIGMVKDYEDSAGDMPDVLPPKGQPPAALPPDGRPGRTLRLKSTDRYVVYVEQEQEARAAA